MSNLPYEMPSQQGSPWPDVRLGPAIMGEQMKKVLDPFRFLLIAVAGWMNQAQNLLVINDEAHHAWRVSAASLPVIVVPVETTALAIARLDERFPWLRTAKRHAGTRR